MSDPDISRLAQKVYDMSRVVSLIQGQQLHQSALLGNLHLYNFFDSLVNMLALPLVKILSNSLVNMLDRSLVNILVESLVNIMVTSLVNMLTKSLVTILNTRKDVGQSLGNILAKSLVKQNDTFFQFPKH